MRRTILLFGALAVLAVAALGRWWYSGSSQADKTLTIGEPYTDAFLLKTRFRTASFAGLGGEAISGELPREIARQAFLIAAREELGLPTRDATLREPFLDAEGEELVALDALASNGMDGRFSTSLVQFEGSQSRLIWSAEYRCPESSYQAYLAMVRQIEADSRTRIAEAMRQLGYDQNRE